MINEVIRSIKLFYYYYSNADDDDDDDGGGGGGDDDGDNGGNGNKDNYDDAKCYSETTCTSTVIFCLAVQLPGLTIMSK